jgi:hypothetical protein
MNCFDLGSAFGRLASSIFVSECSEGRNVAMFTVYLDAAGNSIDQPFLIVSGYVANVAQWQMFDSTWKRWHKEFQVDMPFHMAEFHAAVTNPERYSGQRNARQDYLGIASDARKAKEFLYHLTRTQLLFMSCGFATIVPMAIYKEFDGYGELSEKISPYTIAAHICMENIRKWEEFSGVAQESEVIVESGDLGQDNFLKSMADERKNPPIPRKKAEFCGLQAADHYGWEMAHNKKTMGRENFVARIDFELQLHGIPKRHREATAETVAHVMNMKGIKPRMEKEFQRFDDVVRDVLKVTHTEIKVKLDKEKAAKKQKKSKKSSASREAGDRA